VQNTRNNKQSQAFAHPPFTRSSSTLTVYLMNCASEIDDRLNSIAISRL